VQRDAVLWVLVAFFGASVVFGTLRAWTEDSSRGTQLLIQVGALVVIVLVIVAIVKIRDRDQP
jgi:hypothetical protein